MHNWERWKNILKCYPFEEKRLNKWEPPYIVQPKYDGVRCRAIPTEAGYMLLSSEENIIWSVPEINVALDCTKLNVELDGELYCHGMTFDQIISITSRTRNLSSLRDQIRFHLFDVVTEAPQFERLRSVIDYGKLSDSIISAPFWVCNNLDEITRVYDKLVADGYEGIIVRHYLNLYERRRSRWVMKFKPKQEDSYEVVGFKEELDKYGNPKDTLGALICRSGDGEVFHVGTGFTEERRREIWEARGILADSTIFAKVKYQHITTGRKVPRFPVFVELEVKT